MKKQIFMIMLLIASFSCHAADPRFTVIKVNVRNENLELFLRDETGQTFHSFDRLNAWLKPRDQQLIFAMNAGMYHPDYAPVGLLVRQGREESPLNLDDGKGNFFLKPNGVFFLSSDGPQVVESSEYPALAKNVYLATQSGPLLVHNGKIHPAFNPNSTSLFIRNGVGVSGNMVVFVISEVPVTFYELATYFRDELNCPNALYLDGHISSLYSVPLKRNDNKTDLGPIFGVVR